MIKKLTSLTFALICTFVAQAQMLSCGTPIPSSRVAFNAGEVLSYAVVYKASIINAEVADITFATSSAPYMGQDCFKIQVVGETRSFYNIFFHMRDIYTTWIDRTTLRPVKATSSIKEGSYKYRTAMDFDWQTLIARTEGQNLKDRHARHHKLPLESCSYDAIALFYNMRSADLSNLKPGTGQVLKVVLEDTVRSVQFRFIGLDKRDIEDFGEVRTLKFACQFATSTDESFKDGAEFFIWLSDDANRIPIYLESPIRVGKVYATLRNWKGLKHPFSSFINPKK